MRILVIIAAVGTLLMSGCDSSPTANTTGAMRGVEFNVTPNTVRVCEPPATAKVSWNAAEAGVSGVKIFVRADGVETLFASSGAKGSADTGAWVRPKTVFILKDADGTQQLATLVIGSESCD